MNYEAIYHSTDSSYCHALDKNTVVIRLRAKRGDLEQCIVCYGDRVCPEEMVRVESAKMRLAASDRFFDYFEAVLHVRITRLCYYFILSDGRTSVYYYGYDFHDRLGSNRNQYFQLPYIREEDIADVPEWAKRAVIYQIFPDSFASAERSLTGTGREIQIEGDPAVRSKSRLGGTLGGIVDNIGYLEDLGINCIYLTPIFTAGEYHKYDTIDYFSVDPCLGDMKTLKELVARCHSSGIRVILDGVFNHCGAGFFAFRDVLEKGEASKYKDWFFIKSFPVNFDEPNYECFAYVRNMPKLNTGNSEVVEYLTNVGVYWIKEADIDGWRLDVANEVDHGFWRHFRKAVRAVKPDAFLVGEVWYDAPEWLSGDQFDSLMNYSFLYTCTDFFAKRVINVKQFSDRIGYLLMRYRKNVQYAQMNLLDSHDVPRFLSQAGLFNFDLGEGIITTLHTGSANAVSSKGFAWWLLDRYETYGSVRQDFIDAPFLTNHDQDRIMTRLRGDVEKAKLAAAIYLTLPGNPFIYYGEEIGMTGSKPDEMIRVPFKWYEEHKLPQCSWQSALNNAATVPVEIQQNDPDSLLSHYKKLIRVRQSSEALMLGGFEPVQSGNRAVIAYERSWSDGNGKDNAIVLYNVSSDHQQVQLDIKHFSADVIFDSGKTDLKAGNGTEADRLVIVMSPMSTVILDVDK